MNTAAKIIQIAAHLKKKRQRWQKWEFLVAKILLCARSRGMNIRLSEHIILVEVHTSSLLCGVNKISDDDGRQGQVWECPSTGDAIPHTLSAPMALLYLPLSFYSALVFLSRISWEFYRLRTIISLINQEAVDKIYKSHKKST
jgi:hypothetical protein